MPEIPVTLIKGDKVSAETDYRDALPVNMYAVQRDVLGAKGYMIEYPGITQIATGAGVDRGGVYNERLGKHYRVSGQSLVDLDGSTVTTLGTVSGTKQVALAYSFNTQCVVADGKMFLYSPAGGFSEVTDSDLGDPIDVVWVDGYYFLTDGEYIYHTDITDETSIDPLKFATAEFMPDDSLGLGKTQDNKVIVFGRYTTEYFVNAAQENFAFQRVETRAQKIGIVATHAKCEAGVNFYITGGRKEEAVGVHRLTIGSSEKISTREIDKILSAYTEPELSDMRMEARKENDTAFILIHLPNEVLCFNESIAKTFGVGVAWSILKTDINGNTPYRAINGVFDARTATWIYGDKTDSRIGQLDNTINTHYGDNVEWILYTPFVNLEENSINKLEIETIPGHSATDDATVAISTTYDGVIYSQEWWNLYGEPYNYNTRFYIRRLGYVSDWIGFKLRGASSSRMAFGLMTLDVG
jgi:hypothetical protein